MEIVSYAKRINSRDLLYNTVPIVNMVLCILESVKRIDFMLNSLPLTTNQKETKQRDTMKLRDIGSICYLGVVRVSWVFAFVRTHQIIHIKYV